VVTYLILQLLQQLATQILYLAPSFQGTVEYREVTIASFAILDAIQGRTIQLLAHFLADLLLIADHGLACLLPNKIIMRQASELSLLALESSSLRGAPVSRPYRLCVAQYSAHMDVQDPQMLKHG